VGNYFFLYGIKRRNYNIMAKKDFSISFNNCTISLENNEIVEYSKKDSEQTKIYTLSDVLNELKGEDRRFNITIKESVDLVPSETEGLE
jgi:hypothetical protein